MASLSQQLARGALSLSYAALPPEVVHEAKRVLLDALGCALTGYQCDAQVRLQRALCHFGGTPQVRVFGNGEQLPVPQAALINGCMARYLDYNDNYVNPVPAELKQDPSSHRLAERRRGGGHFSETIPGILAMAEALNSPPREVITAVVLAYDLLARMSLALRGQPIEDRGWKVDSQGAIVMPIVLGRMMGLDEEQISHAVGISGSQGMVLGILDASGEPNTMARNLRFPFTVERAIKAVYMAREGFTGPVRLLEGQNGFIQSMLRGEFEPDTLLADSEHFHILDVAYKAFAAEHQTLGHVSCTVHLVREHDIKPEDVDRVVVRASQRAIRHTADPAKRYPHDTETASHSSWFLTAVAITDRTVGPRQHMPQKFSDPTVLSLMERVHCEADPALDPYSSAGEVIIHLKDGRQHQHRVIYPKGDPLNRMTDRDLEDKFTDAASLWLGPQPIERLLHSVWNLDRLDAMHAVLDRMMFDQHRFSSPSRRPSSPPPPSA